MEDEVEIRRKNRLSRLSEKEINKYKDVFQLFDKNKTGRISLAELGEVLGSVGQLIASDVELKVVLDELDSTRTGGLNLQDFYALLTRTDGLSRNEEMKEVFRILDKDKDGFISANDLRTVLIPLGESLSLEEINEMIRIADKDGNGLVNEQEFIDIMNKEN
ncbi:calmodulin [Eurytemora carolleeae]|uniref:calmodulin n=1 Tax=Eurytemora carolleeae TaxID=1294199 RepID=UPI000C777ABD|nr:calmodulin [Eurytemora carolleeae]|eukprot:XP_023336253.1 calmodulin-like [Eurytemora affinis]